MLKKILPDYKLPTWSYYLMFYLLLSLFIVPVAFHQIYANDIWKAMYSGRYLAQNGQFPHHSEFTFSPVKNDIIKDSFTWLGNLFFYGLHKMGGVPGLQLFRLGLVLFAVIIIHSLVRYKFHPLIFLMLIVFVFGIKQKMLLRNALFSIPFLTILFWLWYRVRFEKNTKYFWGILVLFLLWSNIHGSYLFGVVFLFLLLLGECIDYLLNRSNLSVEWLKKSWLFFLLICLSVIFIKPFPDYSLISYSEKIIPESLFLSVEYSAIEVQDTGSVKSDSISLIKSSDENNTNLSYYYKRIRKYLQNTVFTHQDFRSAEFKFVFDDPGYLFVTVSVFVAVLGGILFMVAPHAVRFSFLLSYLAVVVLGLGYIRTVGYIPLVVLPIIFIKYREGDFEKFQLSNFTRFICYGVIILLGLNMAYYLVRGEIHEFIGNRYHVLGWGKHARLSDPVPEYILDKYPDEKVFNAYGLGSFLLWKWMPRKKVYFDTKSGAYTTEFRRHYAQTILPKLVDEQNFKYVVLPLESNWNDYHFIPRKDWEVMAVDQGMIFYRRIKSAEYKSRKEICLLSEEEIKKLHPLARRNLNLALRYIKNYQNTYSADETKSVKENFNYPALTNSEIVNINEIDKNR